MALPFSQEASVEVKKAKETINQSIDEVERVAGQIFPEGE